MNDNLVNESGDLVKDLVNDCISRQAAIKTAHLPVIDDAGYEVVRVDDILALPSAQRWIPCKERLPEKSGQYYVSGGDKVWICEFLIIPSFIGGWCNDVANPVVQAWMPLPKPWEGGAE